MYRMIRSGIIIVVFLALLAGISCQPQRLVNASHKSQPEWVFGIQRGFLIGYGTDKNIVDARSKAIMSIRSQIAESVYSEIQSRKQMTTKEIQNENTFKLISSFITETISTSGEGIVMRGVSISNATDHYYEVKRNRETNEESVFYALKYPFSRFDLQFYLDIWDKRQQALITRLKEVEKRNQSFKSVEDLVNDIYLLNQIRESMIGEGILMADAMLDDMYRRLHGIQFKIIEEGDGYVIFGLSSQGKDIALGLRPLVSADGVIVESVFQKGSNWVIRYGESNRSSTTNVMPAINIYISYKAWEVKYSHTINPKIEFELLSPLIFHVVSYSMFGLEVRVFDCLVQTRVKGLGGVILDKILLNPVKIIGMHKRPLSPISIEFSGGINSRPGSTVNSMRVTSTLNRSNYSTKGSTVIITEGSLYYTEKITGNRKIIHFKNLELKTDW